MALEGEERIVPRHARPVVRDPDESQAAILEVDLDVPGARVERVLEQFLHDGRGAFDHLAGGDLVDEPRGKDLDEWHALSYHADPTV